MRRRCRPAVRDVVCRDLQTAQDALQAAGFVNLTSRDATYLPLSTCGSDAKPGCVDMQAGDRQAGSRQMCALDRQ